MKIFRTTVIVLSVCFLMTGGLSAQVCGDADDNGNINILDILIVLDHIAGVPNAIDLGNADCDGVTGVSMSDVVALTKEFFEQGSLNCNVSGSYGLATASNDTIFIPYMTNIPANVDDVYLLVVGSFSEVTRGVYVPLLENGAGANGLFELDGVFAQSQTIGGGIQTEPNKRVLFNSEFFQADFFDGVKNLNLMHYTRSSPGVANVAPEAYDRETPWEISLARNNDLYLPVISYYEVDGAAPVLEFSEESLHFHALADAASPDTFTVDITQGLMGVGYKLTSPTSWIEIDQPSGVTPATVSFTADAAGLGVLDYTGKVYVSYDGFSPVIDTLELTLTVHPIGNAIFPAGDVNCDEALNIIDLTYLVDFFFRGGLVPYPCE